MIARQLRSNNWAFAVAAALVLLVGLACGYASLSFSRPAPRERALLWDDYIVATAALYHREGDVNRAKERLQKIGVEDPGRTVAALAAVYVPDGSLADGGGAALRDLAIALTGRNVAVNSSTGRTAAPSASSPVSNLAIWVRTPWPWLALGLLSLAWLGVTANASAGARRGKTAAFATVPALSGEDDTGRLADDQGMAPTQARPVPESVRGTRPAQPPVAVTLAYRADGEPYEQMVPIVDPQSGKVIGGCGLATGPSAPGVSAGHLGLLVWLHESGSAEPPQTLGLVATPVVGAGEDAIREWMAYARLPELVLARPGVTKSFETRRLRASLYVTDVGTVAIGQGNDAVISRLRVHVEVTFKKRPS